MAVYVILSRLKMCERPPASHYWMKFELVKPPPRVIRMVSGVISEKLKRTAEGRIARLRFGPLAQTETHRKLLAVSWRWF